MGNLCAKPYELGEAPEDDRPHSQPQLEHEQEQVRFSACLPVGHAPCTIATTKSKAEDEFINDLCWPPENQPEPEDLIPAGHHVSGQLFQPHGAHRAGRLV